MRVYIAGPTAGYPDGNRAAFAITAAWLAGLGHAPINPHDVTPREHDGDCPAGPEAGEGGRISQKKTQPPTPRSVEPASASPASRAVIEDRP